MLAIGLLVLLSQSQLLNKHILIDEFWDGINDDKKQKLLIQTC